MPVNPCHPIHAAPLRRQERCTMNTVLQCAVMLVVVLIGVPGYTAERLAPYDDFNATHIDPDKWFGFEFGTEPRGAGTEAIRQIQDNRLRLVYRAYGRT